MLLDDYINKLDVTRKRNAEIHIPHNISIVYIEKIVFKTAVQYQKFISKLNDDNIIKSLNNKIIIDSTYFY